ncbi:hypothetical protein HK099_003669 [Clydaea vesicula]|uniref:Transcription factor BYE1 n=1 Tax=Clydaea vesicula TaxID=447962 RepID=A0AAD5U1E3_9FUNG|nr:hypothetical protein HK099_003669 [Clydaea vesicula]KAJ3389398.1 hypothetical protein HDU92_001084 [Lobulomyces angularis]
MRQKQNGQNERGQKIYCLCRAVDDGNFMIMCETCSEWFHGDCVGITEEEGKEIETFECALCIDYQQNGGRNGESIEAKERIIYASDKLQTASEQSSRAKTRKGSDTVPSPIETKSNSLSTENLSTLCQDPCERDPVRRFSRKGFRETIETFFQEVLQFQMNKEEIKASLLDNDGQLEITAAKSESMIKDESLEWLESLDFNEIKVNLHDAEGYSSRMEDSLFKEFSEKNQLGNFECGPKYKSKFRSIQFNLKDKNNAKLRRRILYKDFEPEVLVTLTADQLANENIHSYAAQVRKQSYKSTVKPEGQDILIAKTHKGEVEIVLNKDVRVIQLDKTKSHQDMKLEEEKKILKQETLPFKKIESLDEILKGMNSYNEGKGVVEESSDGADCASPLLTGSPAMYLDSPPMDNYYLEEDKEQLDITMQLDEEDKNKLDGETIWEGKVSMPQVGKFNGTCQQVAGKKVGGVENWEDILPIGLNIDGRIPKKRVLEYLDQQKLSQSKEVVVLKFNPTVESQEDQVGYNTLFTYFKSRDKYAVIPHHYVSVKDMYIVPLGKDDELPEFLNWCDYKNKIFTIDDAEDEYKFLLEKNRKFDILLGVLVLHKNLVRREGEYNINESNNSHDLEKNKKRKEKEELSKKEKLERKKLRIDKDKSIFVSNSNSNSNQPSTSTDDKIQMKNISKDSPQDDGSFQNNVNNENSISTDNRTQENLQQQQQSLLNSLLRSGAGLNQFHISQQPSQQGLNFDFNLYNPQPLNNQHPFGVNSVDPALILNLLNQIQQGKNLEDYLLIELPVEFDIQNTKQLFIKGEKDDEAVICSDIDTFQIKQNFVSNSLLLTKKEVQPYDNEVVLSIKKILDSHLEVVKAKPRLHLIEKILEGSIYDGKSNEISINEDKHIIDFFEDEESMDTSSNSKGTKFYSLNDLIGIIQASEKEIVNRLDQISALNINGCYRIVSENHQEYLLKLIMNGLIINDCDISHFTFEDIKSVVNETDDEYEVVLHLILKNFCQPCDATHFRFSKRKVTRFFGKLLLANCENSFQHLNQPKKLSAFLTELEAAMPDTYFEVDLEHLKGLYFMEDEVISNIKCIRYFNKDDLVRRTFDNNEQISKKKRFADLFYNKAKWKLDEILPYIDDLVEGGAENRKGLNALLLKYARKSIVGKDEEYTGR